MLLRVQKSLSINLLLIYYTWSIMYKHIHAYTVLTIYIFLWHSIFLWFSLYLFFWWCWVLSRTLKSIKLVWPCSLKTSFAEKGGTKKEKRLRAIKYIFFCFRFFFSSGYFHSKTESNLSKYCQTCFCVKLTQHNLFNLNVFEWVMDPIKHICTYIPDQGLQGINNSSPLEPKKEKLIIMNQLIYTTIITTHMYICT